MGLVLIVFMMETEREREKYTGEVEIDNNKYGRRRRITKNLEDTLNQENTTKKR